MVTGYERQMYADISKAAKAMESLAKSADRTATAIEKFVEAYTNPPVELMEAPPNQDWIEMVSIKNPRATEIKET